ncbi:MAG: histidine kinase [Halobacteriovoraceae bacterium]|nr:histidine kinase [Halobacteriovoraceae bacterium]
MSDSNSAIIQEFLVESFDNLSNINDDLTQYEKNIEDYDLLNSIYRKIHTLKGSASFLGLNKLQEITHTVESILDHIRDKDFNVNSDLIDIFLESFDICVHLLRNIENSGTEGDLDTSDILRRLKNSLEAELLGNQMPQGKDQAGGEKLEGTSSPATEADNSLESLIADHINPPTELSSESSVLTQKVEENTNADKPEPEVKEAAKPAEAKPAEEVKKVEKPKPAPVKPKATPPPGGRSNISDSIVRVNVHLLDKIMNVVGELVITRNQILQYSKFKDDADLNRYAQQLNVITTDLQTDIMTTRMQPVGSVFNKFERIVRDLSRTQKKKVHLEIIGQDTELDKTLLEVIKDPMTHLIRNSLDHGLETPEEREEKGKNPEGILSIKAYHEGGQVVIEIADDGNGISSARVRNKAVEKGIMTREEVDGLSLNKVHTLIFHPGFSTAEQVTNISGRGVGMDVVKSNIEKIGGEVEVQSEEGRGTTFRLKIPLTLAIVPALVVEGGGETFAIHQKNLVELVLLEEKDFTKIEHLHGKEFFRLRGDLIPIIRLNEVLGISKDREVENPVLNIIVLKAEGKTYGLIVDEILDTQEIVVKPLDRILKNINYYAGSTIMGDGRVALIIDAFGFYNQFDSKESAQKEEIGKREVVAEANYDTLEVVLYKLGDERTYAVPLSLIDRLEEIDCSRIEWSGNQSIIRYRNTSMPLINVENLLGLNGKSVLETQKEGKINCIVTSINGVFFGVIVSEIMDIAMSETELDTDTVDRNGLMGTIYINDRLITLVDLYEMINMTEVGKKLFKVDKSVELSGEVLVVEDSSLYRRIYEDILTDIGLKPIIVRNGEEGLSAFKNNPHVKMVITDVEMPVMSGHELSREIRESNNQIPIIAVSARLSENEIQKGEESGFTTHLEKLNKKELVTLLEQYLG